MKKIRILLAMVMVLVMAASVFTGCAQKQEAAKEAPNEAVKEPAKAEAKEEPKGKTYTLKVGMVVTETDPMYKGALELKKNVEERTKGQLKIEVYPSSQLGDTKDLQEQAKVGANVAVITDPGRLAEIVPDMGILGAPYVVENFEEARKLVTSDLFKKWDAELVNKGGYKVLSFNWYQGDRHLLTKKPINKPEDLKGLKLRTPGSPVWMETVKAMGAAPTGLAWAEVYPGLQQKVIDGLEAQYPAIYGAKLYEVVTDITKTAHFQLITGLVCGKQWFDTLPKDLQDILLEESLKAGDTASKITIDSLKDYEDKMKAAGVRIVEADKETYKKMTEVVYEKLKYTELRKEVNKVLGK